MRHSLAVLATVSNAEPRSVTSRASASTESGVGHDEVLERAGSRAVATTLSPRPSAASAPLRPKPREVPVMNQVLAGTRAMLHGGG
jgi:hypothetical protein